MARDEERLARSQDELARRVDAQRTLGEISARIAVIREPGEILQSVVEAARRLIGSDGAHLTLMRPDGPPGPGTDASPDMTLAHCSPFSGEVPVDGRCVCPPGTAYEPFAGLARCLPPFPSGKPHDCGRQLPHMKAGDGGATPDRYCFCAD